MARTFDPSSGELGKVRQFKNAPERIARFVRTLRASGCEPEICYEASSCTYVIYRRLRARRRQAAATHPHVDTCSKSMAELDRDINAAKNIFISGRFYRMAKPAM